MRPTCAVRHPPATRSHVRVDCCPFAVTVSVGRRPCPYLHPHKPVLLPSQSMPLHPHLVLLLLQFAAALLPLCVNPRRYLLGMAKPGSSSTSVAAGSFPPVSGAAFLASVPHTGNKQLVTRFLFRDPIFAAKLTWWVCEACAVCVGTIAG